MVDQAKATFQNLKKCFSKKKNELKISNKSQINQIFTRQIKSCLKKDFLLVNFIFCIKLFNPLFSSHLRNNSCTHFFFFSFSSLSFWIKPLVAKKKVFGGGSIKFVKSAVQFVIFKQLSYCFKETKGFDVNASFASCLLLRLSNIANQVI